MHNFKNLKVWQKSVDLAVKIYKVTAEFPTSEKFGMTSQRDGHVYQSHQILLKEQQNLLQNLFPILLKLV